MEPLFMTDTEVSVMLFDLWNRVYGYPLEVIIEALAPTTELDFDLLPPEKQRLYDSIQTTHVHASPDGPWFFIIARNIPETRSYQLIGITDTAMLRPQVFSLYDGDVQIGLVCSEKQAIDATLRSLAAEDPRFSPVADKYWNARGGSFDDGGAFMFSVQPAENGGRELVCQNKFGVPVPVTSRKPLDITKPVHKPEKHAADIDASLHEALEKGDAQRIFQYFRTHASWWDYNTLRWAVSRIGRVASKSTKALPHVIDALTLLVDRQSRWATRRTPRLPGLSPISSTRSCERCLA